MMPVSASVRQRDAGAPDVRGERGREPLTTVRLIWIEGRIEHWIRFGRAVQDRIVDRRTRIVAFAAGTPFAFVRWASNDHGTVMSRIDIVVAAAIGAHRVTLPGVEPGGTILLRMTGWPRVQRVLEAIDQVEKTGVDPCDAAPDHWSHLHNRMIAGLPARAYSIDRHRAWLRRQELQP